MSKAVELSVVRSDVAEIDADLLLLKFARRFYGADETVAFRLTQAKIVAESRIAPEINEAVLVPTEGAIVPRNVMFLGTERLGKFRYQQMRRYAQRSIELIDEHSLTVKTLATTVHGAGYGLDIEESLHALIFGFQQAFVRGLAPSIEKLVFVERNGRRFDIIRKAIFGITELSRPVTALADKDTKTARARKAIENTGIADGDLGKPERVPNQDEKKKLVFVAMPFAQEFEDVYQFGIYEVVRRCGFVCERVDESYYAGNMVERIKEGISNAEFVIADLTSERPNVYLEVGYAWGLETPVLLIAREGQNLHFDLAQHKCIFYPTIVRLADSLEQTIRNLFPSDAKID